MSGATVAIIDIGSNSIKTLIATRGNQGGILPLHTRTIDARISAGISRTSPRLSEEGMARGLEAVQSLLVDADAYSASTVLLVATSAVRDAQNGTEFRRRVLDATGREIRILTGDEEANLIGRGLTADPALTGLQDFYVFDLGGGSLECLAFRDRRIEQAVSLQLGCVRLTERFVADPTAPLDVATRQRVAAHTRTVLAESGFTFSLLPHAVAVGTGGTVTTARSIAATRRGKEFDTTDPVIAVSDLRGLLDELGAMPLPERKQVPGLPPPRADVYPVALITLITIAELGGFSAFHNSVYNLRYGLADQALGAAIVR